jgi:hypothetical protein
MGGGFFAINHFPDVKFNRLELPFRKYKLRMK